LYIKQLCTTVLLPARRLLARSLLSKDVWLAGCHTPVLCLNGETYLKFF